jgi:hypothetical protein
MAMRTNLLAVEGWVMLLTLVATRPGAGQGPGAPDLDRAILGQIKEAYKSVYEAPQDFRDELRGYYKNPTPQREAAMLKEVRRLFLPTPQQEQAILYEIRKAYMEWSPEQEQRIYQEIVKAERLPEGVVPPSVQSSQMSKLFAKLDVNGDGALSSSELPEVLRAQRAQWDDNSDGLIGPEEFVAYYRGRLRWVSEQVATGKIELGLKRGGPDLSNIPPPEDERPVVYRAGKLPPGIPAWFVKIDTNKDGQIGLYEWRRAGKSIESFAAMDRNDDGLTTPIELLRYMTKTDRDPWHHPSNSPSNSTVGELSAKKY